MRSELLSRIAACRDCLKHLRTPDEAAYRRLPAAADEDGWMSPFGSPYAVDVNKILCSKAIRRLARKTQVIALSKNSHTRDRRIHVDEVAGTAMAIGRILGLNEALCQAGALGHDLGHAPFGHCGESMITKLTGKEFRHEVFGVVVCQKIERKGGGLNLTHQTLECILNHSRGAGELTLTGASAEADVVMYSDKISYIFADYNDVFTRRALHDSRFRLEDFPGLKEGMDWFGANHRERTAACIAALCLESAEKGRVCFRDSEAAQRFDQVKKLMYKAYTLVPPKYHQRMLELVHEYLPPAVPGVQPEIVLALLNDLDVAWLAQRTASGVITREDLSQLAVADILDHLKDKIIDFADPDLGW